jgi:cytochrome b6-f complex iron-sulfur subunit
MTTTVPEPAHPNRREFLYYLGGASIALTLAGACGAVRWLTSAQNLSQTSVVREVLNLDQLPIPNGDAILIGFRQSGGRAWLVNVNGGLVALNPVCPFRSVLVRWQPTNNRFECPHCGSKFTRDGTYIEGPARTGLAHFLVEVNLATGLRHAEELWQPVSLQDAQSVVIDGGVLFQGKPRPDPPI